MNKNGKLFLISDRNNIIVEASIDKIYKRTDLINYNFNEVDSSAIDNNFKIFNKITFISYDDYNKILSGDYKGRNKLICMAIKSKSTKLGFLDRIKIKLKKICKKG